MECVDVATLSWAACWTRSCLFWNFYFARSDSHWSNCNFLSIFRIFRQEVNRCAVLLKRVQRSEGKCNICKPSKEHVRMCKDYVTGIYSIWLALDNIILELCDSCDYFANPLLIEKPIKFTLCLYVQQPDRFFKILHVWQSKLFFKNFS